MIRSLIINNCSVNSLTAMIPAFQAGDPGSTPG